MRQIELEVLKKNVDEEGVNLFRSFCGFVERCNFSTSKHMQFICENWRLDSRQLVDAWGMVDSSYKEESTFRNQISVVSRMLYGLFPYFDVDIFLSAEGTKENRNKLRKTIKILGVEDLGVTAFLTEVTDYFEDNVPKKDYTISECKKEIDTLRLLMRSDVFALLDSVDSDKLKWLLSVMRSPLSRIHGGGGVNQDKVELLDMLYNKASSKRGSSQVENIITKEVYVEVPETIPYRLNVTKVMSDLLSRKLDTKSEEDGKEFLGMSEDEKSKAVSRIASTLHLLTEAGFANWLNRTNSMCLMSAVLGDYDVSTPNWSTDGLTREEKSFKKGSL